MIEAYLRRSKRHAAYRKLFLNESGRLKVEAEAVLDDLYDFSRFYKNVPADPQSLAVVEGSRQLVRHILKRVGTTDQELKRQLRLGETKYD